MEDITNAAKFLNVTLDNSMTLRSFKKTPKIPTYVYAFVAGQLAYVE
jgi:aminopeptidase N